MWSHVVALFQRNQLYTAYSFRTLAPAYQSTRRHIPEDHNLNTYSREGTAVSQETEINSAMLGHLGQLAGRSPYSDSILGTNPIIGLYP